MNAEENSDDLIKFILIDAKLIIHIASMCIEFPSEVTMQDPDVVSNTICSFPVQSGQTF